MFNAAVLPSVSTFCVNKYAPLNAAAVPKPAKRSLLDDATVVVVENKRDDPLANMVDGGEIGIGQDAD